MDLVDTLLGHDEWTSQLLLDIAKTMDDEQLDADHGFAHRTIRRTLNHLIHNVDVWGGLMDGVAEFRQPESRDSTTDALERRLRESYARFGRVARDVARRQAWDDEWVDVLDTPPQPKTFGAAIAHVITHNMHHRAQLLQMFRLSGLTNLPEGDVFSWVKAAS